MNIVMLHGYCKWRLNNEVEALSPAVLSARCCHKIDVMLAIFIITY